MRGFINFPVATFFFLSGLFNKSTGEYFGSEKTKFAKRILRLFIPYIFWTIFYLCVGYSLSLIGESSFDWGRIPKALLTGGASAPLYFLNVLLQLTIITPFLVKIIRSEKSLVRFLRKALIFVTPAYIIVLYAYDFSTGTQLPLYHLPFVAWFSYYYLGLLLANKRLPSIQTLKNLPCSVLIAFIALFIAIWEGLAIYSESAGTNLFVLAISQTRLGSMLFSLAAINLFFRLNETRPVPNRLLSALGNYSFGIYAFHMFWMMPLAFLAGETVFPASFAPAIKILQGGLCLILTFFAVKFSEKILGEKIGKLIGFK